MCAILTAKSNFEKVDSIIRYANSLLTATAVSIKPKKRVVEMKNKPTVIIREVRKSDANNR